MREAFSWPLPETEQRSLPTHHSHAAPAAQLRNLLECSMTSERHEASELHGLSRAGFPLLVRYDLEAARQTLTKQTLAGRRGDMWRCQEILPVRAPGDIISLGEAATPLVTLPRTAQQSGGSELIVKDEGRLPTGSFKARGIAMAVAMAKGFGVTRIAMPTNGNAGAALAAYAARAGIEAIVLCPPTRRRSTCARSPCMARASIASTASSTIAARSSPKAPVPAIGSTCRR
jgi:threonine synthase